MQIKEIGIGHDVKKLILKICLLIFFTTLLFSLISWLNPYQEKDKEIHFSASIIEKQARLHSVSSPKIILVAGSNFLYGIDSQLLEDSLQMPVVNMSLQYFLGSDFLLKQLEEALQPGDIVVMGFEYMVTKEGFVSEKIRTASFYEKASKWISFQNMKEKVSSYLIFYLNQIKSILFRLFTKYEQNPTIEDTNNELFRYGINLYGDLVSQDNNISNTTFTPISMVSEKPFFSVVTCMDSVAKLHSSSKFYYFHPTLSQSLYSIDKELIATIQLKLESMNSVSLLSKPTESVYPDSSFHNSQYHIKPDLRRFHTLKLIRAIRSKNTQNAI